MSDTISYNTNDYADILKLISDNNYAQDKHIKVKNFEHLFVLKYNKKITKNIGSKYFWKIKKPVLKVQRIVILKKIFFHESLLFISLQIACEDFMPSS